MPFHLMSIQKVMMQELDLTIQSCELIYTNALLNIYKCWDTQGKCYAVKHLLEGVTSKTLETEARMLADLKKSGISCIPLIFYNSSSLLIMEWIENKSDIFTLSHQKQLASILSHMHSLTHTHYGYFYDNTIGILPQSNTFHEQWCDFFCQSRIITPAYEALHRRKISTDLCKRLVNFAHNMIPQLLVEPKHASLIHGDVWRGNILCSHTHIRAIIDPALYFAHYEMEIAYCEMLGLVNSDFYTNYTKKFPLDDDFFHIRCPIYQIYPQLVHAMMWSESYLHPIDNILKIYGY